jgi:hypothetical protein
MSNFNIAAFLEDAKKVHSLTNELPDINVNERLDEFIDYDRSLFSRVLDDICNNMVGNTMFTLLMMKLPSGQRLKIINIGPEEARELLVKQKGSSYSHTTYAVKVNLNVYDRFGVGIPERQYYCMDGNRNISLKPKSLSASIFHEFTHCLHHIEDAVRYERDRALPRPADKLWTSKEECRTIGGYIPPDIYDPICDNCFDLYESVSKHLPVRPTITKPVPCALSKKLPHRPLMHRRGLQPMAKAIPYRPRFGHIGYVEGRLEYSEENLLQYCRWLNFNLDWTTKYI